MMEYQNKFIKFKNPPPPNYYEIERKNDENKIIGEEIDNIVRNKWRYESRYSPLKLTPQIIMQKNENYSRALSSNNIKQNYPGSDKNLGYLQQPRNVNNSQVLSLETQQKNSQIPSATQPDYDYTKGRNPSSVNKRSYSNDMSYSKQPNQISNERGTNYYRNSYSSNYNNNYQNDYQPNQRYQGNYYTADESKSYGRRENNLPSSVDYNINNRLSPSGYRDNQYEKSDYETDRGVSEYRNKYTPHHSRLYKYYPENRVYSPYRNDYLQSRFGDYTYNYFLNAPMRGDISEDWRYPPQYYYYPRFDEKTYTYENKPINNY